MSIARDRANRSGTDPLQIDNTKLITDSGDLKVQDTSGNEKKLIADEIHVGTGSDKVILKRDSSTGKVAIQTQASGQSPEGGTIASTTIYATTDLLPTNPSDGQQALVTANNFLYIAKSSGWYKIAEITNTTPSITSAGDASYTFLTDGTPVSIEITATDAEVGTALQYKYVVSSGSIGSSATVTSSATSGGTYSALAANTLTTNKFFKVTPSTNSAHAGTFSLTFSASDGVAVATSSASSFTLQFDVSGSYKFDGSGDYVTTTDNSSYTFGTGAFSVECFYNVDFDTSGSGTIFLYDFGSEDVRVTFKSGAIRAQLGSETQLSYSISGNTLDRNNFHHHALTRDGSGNVRLYHNGSEVGSYSSSTYNVTSTTLRIGDKHSGSKEFTGYISNFRIVKGSLVYTPSTATSGLDFGSGAVTSLASNDSFDFGTNDFTIEFFYKWSTSSGYQTPLNHQYNATDAVTIQSNANTYKWGFFGSGMPVTYESSNATQDVWYHYAFVRNGNNVRIYRDGVVTRDYTHTGTIGGVDPTEFGHGNTHYDKGKISNFRVVKGTALYTSAGFTIPTVPLTAISGTSLLLFQENSGTTLSDGSTNNVTVTKGSGHTILTNDGPTYGSITVPTTNLTAITNTKLLAFTETEPEYITTGSTLFDGTNDSLSIPSFAMGGSDYTIEMWFHPTSLGNYVHLYDGRGGHSSSQHATLIQLSNTGTVRFYSSSFRINGTDTVSANTWNHVALERVGNINTLYLNGVSQGTYNDGGTTFVGPANNVGRIGSDDNGAGSFFPGYISDFRIVIGSAVYNGAFTPPTSTLTAITNTQILTSRTSSGTITDASSYNHTITANNGAAASAFGVVKPPTDISTASNTLTAVGNTEFSYATPFEQGTGGSVYFPSSGDYLYVSTSTDLIIGTNDFTIESWAYFTDFSGYPVLFDRRQSSANNQTIEVQTNGKLRWYSGGSYRIQSDTAMSTNTWHHIAMQRISNVTKMYLDGKEQSTSYSDSTNYSGSSVFIGKHYSNNSGYPYGYISNYREVIGSSVYTTTSPSGGSTSFDGTGDYLATQSSSNLQLGSGNYTIEYWMKATNFDSTGNIFDNRDAGVNNSIITNTNTSGQHRLWYVGGYRITSSALSTNTWYHIAIVRNSGVTTMYINGVAESTTWSDTTNFTGQKITLGTEVDGASSEFHGYISNFRVVVGTAVYTSNFTPQNSALTAITNTKLLTCQNSTGAITDASSSNLTITANGNAAASTSKPFNDYFTVPTSKLTAVTNTKLLTCNDSNIINDESTLSNTITISGNPIATRFHPF
tara:strand:+ start:504 stop:4391 length:3888 start_codon:yes stop_codon:yes gene_type:complete